MHKPANDSPVQQFHPYVYTYIYRHCAHTESRTNKTLCTIDPLQGDGETAVQPTRNNRRKCTDHSFHQKFQVQKPIYWETHGPFVYISPTGRGALHAWSARGFDARALIKCIMYGQNMENSAWKTTHEKPCFKTQRREKHHVHLPLHSSAPLSGRRQHQARQGASERLTQETGLNVVLA